jgi:signal transduction histidine kinase
MDSSGRQMEELWHTDKCYQLSFSNVTDELERPQAVAYVLTDVTSERRLEAQLRRCQHLQTIGQLAGGIAHDFNNLLTAILGNVTLLLGDHQLPERATETIKVVERATSRAAALARQLLCLSRPVQAEFKPLDLRLAVDESVSMMRNSLRPRIQIVVNNSENLWPVLADATQINQVLVNLCLNAKDAMSDGGTLTISVSNVCVDEAAAKAHPAARSGEHVRLSVRDTGHGIPFELIPKVFEAFFSTKADGEATGLGLSMVAEIVNSHRGWVECTSGVGEGTVFDVYLPRAIEPPTRN